MSIIKTSPDLVPAETWLAEVSEEWKESAVAIQAITNSQGEMFKEKLSEDNAWNWFQHILLTDVPHQINWLEKVILKGVPIDKPWTALDTGHQVTIFDLIETVEGGIRPETRFIFSKIRTIYEILFMRKDVQEALDIIGDLEENRNWLQLNMILSTYIEGPMLEAKPLMHYLVLMGRYDMVRGLLTSAQALNTEFKSSTYLQGWINMTDEEGSTVLHITAKQRRESWAKWFVGNSADPMIRDVYNKTPFHYAPCKKYLELFWDKIDEKESKELLNELLIQGLEDGPTLRWVLEKGANPNTKGAFKTASKKVGMISILVRFGGDPTLITPSEDWDADVIREWLQCGGSGGMRYAEYCVKYLAGIKTGKWICFLISLHNGFIREATAWWLACDETDRENFHQVVKSIEASTSYMSNYQKWLEKVTNIPIE